MQNRGYIERVPVNIKELGDSKKLEQFIQEKGMKAYTFISKDKPQLDIDVVVEASLDFAKYVANKTIVEVWNLQLPVIGIDDLIGMKKEANRDKDRLDLEALLKLKEL
ncbi:MAG: hypothetical protein UW70_C0007G0004 [Candidatus Peregrinibacteria bacterium GW2011_GWA2_44_7]|nr:MAG: hypothetical protein UW70_C0007G0004 [Candidatus Peregrinibacteria bacterium GW2011_GWA2_44_7]